jgi:hypothetical protein
MIDFKIDSEDPQLLRIAIAYDFFFENYGLFLEAAVAAEKNNKELMDDLKKVLNLSFVIADMFMLQAHTQEDNDDNV